MSHAANHPRVLELPRDEDRLATSKLSVRRIQVLLPEFLQDVVADAGVDGVVVVLDGGVESTVAAAMAADALDAERVTGLVMPARLSGEAAARDAEAVASALGIEYSRLQLQPLLTAFQEVIGTSGGPADDLVALENAAERFRMTCAYYVANTRDRLVVGTVNRTQRLLGSVAKHGGNGVDVDLLGDLYRTEVRAVAADLEVPEEVLDRRPRPADRTGPTDAERLGVEPRTLDSLLRLLIDEGHAAEAVADRIGVDTEVVERAKRWCSNTRHKRHSPPKPSMHV